LGLVHPNANAIAGDAGLRDFEECAPDSVSVADAHGIIGQAFDREIFAELSVRLRVAHVGSLETLLPITIRLDLVNKDSAMLASVSLQISLTVSVQIEPADATSPLHWIFPDSGVYGAALPLNIAWETDVYRQ
jgi:hypothetical protein